MPDTKPSTARQTIVAALTALAVVLLVSTLGTLALPASAGAFVYWANSAVVGGTTIGRANLDATGPNQSFIGGASTLIGIAVDAQHVYWANNATDTIGRANLDGTGANQSFIKGATNPQAVAVDAQHVYWTNFGVGRIGRANLDGTGVDQSFITGANFPWGVAVDAQHVYWTNLGANTIGRANIDGNPATVNQSFIAGASGPQGVAVDAVHVYWANNTNGTIGRARADDGSGAIQNFIEGASDPQGVAVDAQYVYWANLNANTIGRADLLSPGTPNQSFIGGANGPRGVAVDSLPHASPTTLACAPATVAPGAPATCTATATDMGPFPSAPGPSPPTGSVAFSSNAPGSFSPTSSCALSPSGSSSSACQITYVPSVAGPATIAAAYSGDLPHAGSNATTTLDVAAPKHALTVTKAGGGQGTVTSSPAGIDCGASCSASFDQGSTLTLTATAAAGSTFAGWGGGCSGTGSCQVRMDADHDIVASFERKPPPNTKIIKAKVNSKKRKASFEFKAIGTATGLRCELKRKHEKARFKGCRSPKTYKRLMSGRYVFKARAVGPGGPDATPAKKRFRISDERLLATVDRRYR